VKVSDLIANPRLAVETIRSNVLNNLRPGQILHASVLTPTSQNSVKLRIGPAELVAQTQVPFTPGQRITLDVVKTGVLPELRLLTQTETTRQFQAEALRAALPKQIPLQRFFDNIRTLSNTLAKNVPIPPFSKAIAVPADGVKSTLLPLATSALQSSQTNKLDIEMLQTLRNLTGSESLQKIGDRLGPELINRIKTVLENAPNRNQVASPPLLKKFIMESGLFMEPKLAGGQSPGPDLKSNLLLLLFHVRNQMEELVLPEQRGTAAENRPQASPLDAGLSKLLTQILRQTEGSLARIQLNQLSSLPTDEGSRQVWQFEIPVKHPEGFDNFQLRIEREQSHSEKKGAQHRWRLSLHFDLDPLGPVQAQITLLGEQVSALFLTERKESAALIEQQLASLERAFSRVGLKVGHLAAKKSGNVFTEMPNSFPHRLLDEKA
jgi:hypothetical protein